MCSCELMYCNLLYDVYWRVTIIVTKVNILGHKRRAIMMHLIPEINMMKDF